MTFTPRPYQAQAVTALWHFFRTHSTGNPLAVLPTGAGKSIVLAEFARSILDPFPSQRILVATHVKELVEQDANKLEAMLGKERVGVYSAGLKRRELNMPVTVASIQSIAHRIEEVGHIDMLIVDEAHLIPRAGEGRYRKTIDDLTKINPALRVVGLSATPYRLNSGMLHRGDGRIFTHIAIDVGIPQLIDAGYLSPLRSKSAKTRANLTNVHTRGGEWIPRELQEAVNKGDLIAGAVAELLEHASDRKSWIVFAAGIEHAEAVCDALNLSGITAECVFGNTKQKDRDAAILRFQRQEVRALVNVGVLTTGFDAPSIDCVVMMRPTQSPGLFYQMAGRGLRVAEGKKDCLIMDFAGNVELHGPLDLLSAVGAGGSAQGKGDGEPPYRVCPICCEVTLVACPNCTECGYEFPVLRDDPHGAKASEGALLSREQKPIRKAVKTVRFRRHEKEGRPDSLRVEYCHGLAWVSEWICFEHKGFARRKARLWWRERAATDPPETVTEALNRLDELRAPTHLLLKRDTSKYMRVEGVEFEEKEEENAA